jgi:hypothetical protein
MFCPKCGNENPNEAKFCRGCRANLANVLAVVDDEVSVYTWPQKVDADELYSSSLRNTVLGLGVLLLSVMLFFVTGQSPYWVLLIVPSVVVFAVGVSGIVRAQDLNKKKAALASEPLLNHSNVNQLGQGRPDYIKPEPAFDYETNELLETPSVVEDTTRQLEMNSEGETMTLPKK